MHTGTSVSLYAFNWQLCDHSVQVVKYDWNILALPDPVWS